MLNLRIREIMDELRSGGRLNADDFVLIVDLITTCLSAGIELPMAPLSGAERTKNWRDRKKGACSDDVTSHVTDGSFILNNNINKKTKTTRRHTECPLFDEFWKVFPRKIAKPPAIAAWKSALKRGANPQDIIAGAKRYAAEMAGKDPAFIKYAQGWLSGDRWLDEPEKPKSTVVAGPWREFKPEAEIRMLTAAERAKQVEDRMLKLKGKLRESLDVDRPCDTEGGSPS